MKTYIDNIPSKENNKKSEPTLGETLKPFSTIKPADTKTRYNVSTFNGISNVSFPTIITSDSDYYKKYAVLSNETSSEKELTKKDTDESDDESIDVNDIFNVDYLSNVFIGTLSIVGLFIFYRMIQKSR
tara:strand:- start:22774 stop:23160 length:387 start_codon:yes stop_codon:yes gene_type:complete